MTNDIPVLIHKPIHAGIDNVQVNLCDLGDFADPHDLPPGALKARCPKCVEKDLELQQAPTFQEELEALLVKHVRAAKSDTPAYILADYLVRTLEAYELATRRRDAELISMIRESLAPEHHPKEEKPQSGDIEIVHFSDDQKGRAASYDGENIVFNNGEVRRV